MKKVLSALLILLLVFSLSGCSNLFGMFIMICAAGSSDDRAEKTDIIEFVIEHEEALREAVEQNDYTAFENSDIVLDIHPQENAIKFYCGGAGFGAETIYVGFYYTADNDMTSLDLAPSSPDLLTPSGDGFEYREAAGDNRYYTEKICENFYYYEAEY